MSHSHSHRVTVELSENYRFVVRFDDIPNAPPLVCDELPPLGKGRGPNAVALLAAAVGHCLAASLTSCLRTTQRDPLSLSARVTTHVVRKENGRFRVGSIDVELSPEIASLTGGGAKPCQELFEDFCMVTASIRHGIPISVSLGSGTRAGA
jgi:organic hydroperoxide reductase OsmC/OhrA